MGEPEGRGEESFGGQETAGGFPDRRRELRIQAELAWTRVQQVLHRGAAPALTLERLLERVEQLPISAYLVGIALSFLASAGFLAIGRRSISTFIGLFGPLLLGLALLLKGSRRPRRL